jgi:hypothetical protein
MRGLIFGNLIRYIATYLILEIPFSLECTPNQTLCSFKVELYRFESCCRCWVIYITTAGTVVQNILYRIVVGDFLSGPFSNPP